MMKRMYSIGLLLALMFASPVIAAKDYTLPADIGANGTPFKDCAPPPPIPLVYTCSKKVDLKNGDTVVLTSNVTLIIGDDFKVGSAVSINQGIYAFNVTATNVDIDQDASVVMDNLAASGDITIKGQVTLTANVTSSGGTINLKDGGTTVNGNLNAQSGDVKIEDGNNLVTGDVSASNGAGTIDIDGTSIVSGACNPTNARCNGGPGGGTGAVCTIAQIATNGEEFRGISGSSDNGSTDSNIIAVGKDGSLYHYDGTAWVKNTFVSPKDLRDVEVVAANLAYAVGKQGKVLKYDGAAWTTMTPPTNQELMGVWAISSSEVWVVGKKNTLYRWNGANWQNMSGGTQANVDNNQELRDAWGDANAFYALEKDGDLYRYSRNSGPWSKISACSAAYTRMDVRDLWGDGAGNIYIAGKDKKPKPDEATIFRYNEANGVCSKVFSTTTEDNLEGISGNGGTVYAVGKGGLVVDNSSGSFSESVVGGEDYKDVWVSGSGTAYYAGKNGYLTTCSPTTSLDHFDISPATFAASTCLANAITITARDVNDNTLVDYTGTVTISTSTVTTNLSHGNWSKDPSANGVLTPNPDNDDNGSVLYSFDTNDPGFVTLDLSNTHAETLTISVSEGGVSTTSAAITFGDNTFVITEDTVQVAGRPLGMNIAMWTRDGANCSIDSNYNYQPHSLDVRIDRNGVLPAAIDPTIGGQAIGESAPGTPINFNFQTTAGQSSFVLDNSDVGQYRLVVTDNTLLHSDLPIVGISEIMTLRPFGIAVTDLRDTLTGIANPGNAAPASPKFTTAGHNLSATVAGVLWSSLDDSNNDGVLETGVYADNTPAPSFAWDTVLAVSLLGGYTPLPGTPGALNNNSIAQAEFGSAPAASGTAEINDLQYTEVGSFTLQASAADYLGITSIDITGDDIIVGRFIPATFEVAIADDGVLADACGAFTYVGQEFGYDSAPQITVTAMNSLGVRTAQYRDGFVKLDAASLTVVATRDETTTGTDTVLLDVSYIAAPMIFSARNNGIVDYTFGADNYRYGPSAPVAFSKFDNSQVAPFSADINPQITAITDGEVAAIPPGGSSVLNPVGNNQLFGRLSMNNVHGSEVNPLVMPVYTEYWNGFSFQKNTLDTCTAIADGDLLSVADPVGLSVPAVVFPAASAGDVNYRYPAPGAENDGFIDTTTILSTINPPMAAHLWLRYDWNSDGVFDDDPTARATFGIFEGDPVQIYIQQIY